MTGIFAYGLLCGGTENSSGGRDSLIVLVVYIAGVLLLTEVPG